MHHIDAQKKLSGVKAMNLEASVSVPFTKSWNVHIFEGKYTHLTASEMIDSFPT